MRLIRQFFGALYSLLATRAAMDRSNADSIKRVKEGKGELTIVLHGVFATYYGAPAPLVKFLKRHNVNAVSIGYDWRAHLKTQAQEIKRQIEVIMNDAGVSKINIIGISLGGAVARCYIESFGGKEKIYKMVTAFTPFTPDTKKGKNLASRIITLIGKGTQQDVEYAREIKKLFSVKNHLAIYGFHDHISGDQYPLEDVPIKQVGIPGGHTFVSFNPQVMKLTAKYLTQGSK